MGIEIGAVDWGWNVMAHKKNIHFVFVAKWTSPFKSAGGRQFSRLLAAEVCASAVVMPDTVCSEVVWRVLATHCSQQFPFHFPSRASPCAITFQLDSTWIQMHTALHTNPTTGRLCFINYSFLRISVIRSDKELCKRLRLWGESRGYHG